MSSSGAHARDPGERLEPHVRSPVWHSSADPNADSPSAHISGDSAAQAFVSRLPGAQTPSRTIWHGGLPASEHSRSSGASEAPTAHPGNSRPEDANRSGAGSRFTQDVLHGLGVDWPSEAPTSLQHQQQAGNDLSMSGHMAPYAALSTPADMAGLQLSAVPVRSASASTPDRQMTGRRSQARSAGAAGAQSGRPEPWLAGAVFAEDLSKPLHGQPASLRAASQSTSSTPRTPASHLAAGGPAQDPRHRPSALQCPSTGMDYSLRDNERRPMLLPCRHHLSRGAASALLASSGSRLAACPALECQDSFSEADVSPHYILEAALWPHATPLQAVALAMAHQWRCDALSAVTLPPVSAAQPVSVSAAQLDGKDVMIKRFAALDIDRGDDEVATATAALWEISMLSLLRCNTESGTAHVAVQMLGWASAGTCMYVIMPRYRAALSSVLGDSHHGAPQGSQAAAAGAGVEHDRAVAIAFNLACALHALHSSSATQGATMLHGFVAPGNVLLARERDDVVLCCFSHSALVLANGPVCMAAAAVDDSEYCAVELLAAAEGIGGDDAAALRRTISPAADVWGLAVVLLFLLTGARLPSCHQCPACAQQQ
jgi:hypothetical protein